MRWWNESIVLGWTWMMCPSTYFERKFRVCLLILIAWFLAQNFTNNNKLYITIIIIYLFDLLLRLQLKGNKHHKTVVKMLVQWTPFRNILSSRFYSFQKTKTFIKVWLQNVCNTSVDYLSTLIERCLHWSACRNNYCWLFRCY